MAKIHLEIYPNSNNPISTSNIISSIIIKSKSRIEIILLFICFKKNNYML